MTTEAICTRTPPPKLKIAGWLLSYSATESEFVPGQTRPTGYEDDCEEVAAVVLACDAEIYAQDATARQREAWRPRIATLEAEVERLKQREHMCATMDQAEKIALVRALQECAEALGLGNNPTPADVVKAVTAASNAAYLDETEVLGAKLALSCIEAEDMQHWTDDCDTVLKATLKRLISHRKATTGGAA
jgi:hypothetical protein